MPRSNKRLAWNLPPQQRKPYHNKQESTMDALWNFSLAPIASSLAVVAVVLGFGLVLVVLGDD